MLHQKAGSSSTILVCRAAFASNSTTAPIASRLLLVPLSEILTGEPRGVQLFGEDPDLRRRSVFNNYF